MIGERARTSATIEVLTPIWERVLRRSPIRVDDNFFDLGGDPASANRIFAEIAEKCGRELSPVTIYEAPTIATLATIFEKPALPRFSPAVLLKTGKKMPPIFLVPGCCSSVMVFSKLVAQLESGHAIFGMQPRGLDGLQEPFERVEDFAQFYIDAIRDLQPNGPYALMGYSFGGLIALEMAQRLSENGELVALLAMVDTYPYHPHLPLGQRAGVFMRRAIRFVPTILRRAGFNLQPSEGPETDRPATAKEGEVFAPIQLRACLKSIHALRRYNPRYYKGKINFIRAAKSAPHLASDPTAVWATLADELVVETAHGGHWGIITTQAASLANILSSHLEEIRQ
jgi:acetoacetyl-CoA synthetase